MKRKVPSNLFKKITISGNIAVTLFLYNGLIPHFLIHYILL